jgi:SAM-dependent methyltransferase
MNALTRGIHDGYVHDRRVRVLEKHLSVLIPDGASVLDIGCGDGRLASCIQEHRPDLRIRGIDVLIREETLIPVHPFDGQTIPAAAASVDVVLLTDVLHHTEDPMILLREAARVARRAIIIKDHTLDGLLAGPTLRFMDHVGNAHHGVVLTYNYWPRHRWQDAFLKLRWVARVWQDDLRLYPRPADWIFGRSLHFIARLEPETMGEHSQV